ncbi:MAG TPA: FkbM family methyltransferase, partial [Rhodopila sp.]|nr:FkbM family methyltransferase [Rhodopila sp.]
MGKSVTDRAARVQCRRRAVEFVIQALHFWMLPGWAEDCSDVFVCPCGAVFAVARKPISLRKKMLNVAQAVRYEPAMLKNILQNDGFNWLVPGRHGVILCNKNDIVVGRSAIYYGEYFESEVDIFRQIVQPGWHVADIGANIGTHTQALSRLVGPSGWVYAFEVQRLVFQTLCANVANNSLTNVDCERLAVDDHNGRIPVEDVDPTKAVNYGGIPLGHSHAGQYVRSTTIDDYLGGRPLHFMKVDVEGMELACLKGAQKTLSAWKTILYVENDRPEKSRELLLYLHDNDYRCYWHTPLFYNKDNFAQEEEDIYGLGFIDKDGPYFGTIGFAINILCIPNT